MQVEWISCPKCKRNDWGDGLTPGDIQGDLGNLWRRCDCICGFSWIEVFKFSHNESPDGEKLGIHGNILAKSKGSK